jgi:hypothetical protein
MADQIDHEVIVRDRKDKTTVRERRYVIGPEEEGALRGILSQKPVSDTDKGQDKGPRTTPSAPPGPGSFGTDIADVTGFVPDARFVNEWWIGKDGMD